VNVVAIPNWADVDEIGPEPRAENAILRERGLLDRFVVQYAGNMGRTHDLESIVEAANALRDEPQIHFLLIGSGAKAALVKRAIATEALQNLEMAGTLPRSAQQSFLNACDVTLITFVPGMAGVSVPSRMYNVMAAGKPIIAMADPDSEIARVVRENDIGWVVEPGNWRELVQVLLEANRARDRLTAMGSRAHRVAVERYSRENAIAGYEQLVATDSQIGPCASP
jgi:glycosyltransferase involved in cell wall biosynthesis